MAYQPNTNQRYADHSRSFMAELLHSWRLSQQRKRERTQSLVKYRLTREGFHFLLILLFVLTAAVLRNVSLLIVLAGVMTGLLLLQWRVAFRTLMGLSITRNLPNSMLAGQEVDVHVEIRNSRRWLASWLVVVEDRLARVMPEQESLTRAGSIIVDEVPPQSSRASHYSIRFN